MNKLVFAPLLVLVLGSLHDSHELLPESFASPQATVTSYWQRMIERRHAEALDCFVDGNRVESFEMFTLPDLVELRCRNFALEWQPGGSVDVSYQVEYRITLSDSLARFSTGDRLDLTGSGWRISRPLLVATRQP
jgi:hypothetical protein